MPNNDKNWTEEDYERTAREYGWVTKEDALKERACAVQVYYLETRPRECATLLFELASGPIKFINATIYELSHAASWKSLAEQFGIEPFAPELSVPDGLSEKVRDLVVDMRQWLRARGDEYTGGCVAFYNPLDFTNARMFPEVRLVINHDGGGLAPYFNFDYENPRAVTAMREFMSARGFHAEPITPTVTFVYEAG